VVPEHFQIELLLKLQRLLTEGSFTASYKFALLQALIDLAVERGDDSDAPLPIALSDIAEKFISYYWRQVLPYVASSRPREIAAGPIVADAPAPYGSVLRQITQANAVILEAVHDARARFGGSLVAARADTRSWRTLVRKVAQTVRVMPLWKLQTVGGQLDEFLYRNRRGEALDRIELHPGVMFTLRRFHGLVQELVRGEWLRFVRGLKSNCRILGESEDLYEFLFGSERASLQPHTEMLRDIQSGMCFYCLRRIDAKAQVDHFVPWSRYPLDLAHNFVLAHASCNESKSNLLASVEHLERWCARNIKRGLQERFAERRFLYDLGASRAITRWAYGLAEQGGSKVWRSKSATPVELDPRWRDVVGL
jgi:5-methylcytosine-specific restriction endonuclease McrA